MSDHPILLIGSRRCRVLLACCLVWQSVSAQKGGNEILWDNYGVPHIYAASPGKMYYAFGWAQMHNHADLLLRLYGQARGRAAEYWGATFLASDEQVQLFQVPELARQAYIRQDRLFGPLLDSFANGINAFAAAHPEAISPENRQVLPVMPEDVLAHGIRVVYLRFIAGTELGMVSRTSKAGSNACAIAPSRSASRHALLLANPHLPWGDLFTFFEAHLRAPGFNAYGAAVIGMPVLNIAFNDHLGWTLTVNPIDACDRFELKVQGDSYLLDSALHPFEKRRLALKVKQADGSVSLHTVDFYYALHGPVVERKGERAYAMRIAGLQNAGLWYQWHKMAAATEWRGFEAALKMMQLPMFNVIYADNKGNILYKFAGNVPRRREGDWKFWNGVVDGAESKYIWQETLSYGELPEVFNPATGFVQNANDPPWGCTYPALLDPRQFPTYLSSQGMDLRSQRAVRLIRKDSLVTPDGLAGDKLNTGMEAADRFLNDLLEAVNQYPDSLALQAAGVLKKWDRSCNAESRGAVLFARWFDKLTPAMLATPWSPEHSLETPSGLKDPRQAASLLSQAAGETIRDFGSLDVAWGSVYRFRANKKDYPANGGPGKYGVYRTIYFAPDTDGKYKAVAGDSYVAVTEFGRKVSARVLLSYGNASQPGSKHAGDQLELLTRGQLRSAWLEEKEILDHLEEKETF
jgi:acyl-homoserine-lactone acylase